MGLKEKYSIIQFQEHNTSLLFLIVAVSSKKITEHEQKFFKWECDTYGWPDEAKQFEGTHFLVLASRNFKPGETVDDYMKLEKMNFMHMSFPKTRQQRQTLKETKKDLQIENISDW